MVVQNKVIKKFRQGKHDLVVYDKNVSTYERYNEIQPVRRYFIIYAFYEKKNLVYSYLVTEFNITWIV